MTDWNTEALPVLRAAYAVTTRNAAEPYLSMSALDDELGRHEDDVRTRRAVRELIDDGWLELTLGHFLIERPGLPYVIQLTAKTRQLLAGWPADAGEALYAGFMHALDETIAAADSPEERTRLERFRADAADVGKGVLVNVLSNLARIHGISI